MPQGQVRCIVEVRAHRGGFTNLDSGIQANLAFCQMTPPQTGLRGWLETIHAHLLPASNAREAGCVLAHCLVSQTWQTVCHACCTHKDCEKKG